MKIVFFTGNHRRHAFMARTLAATGHLAAIIREERALFLPEPPEDLAPDLQALYRTHFERHIASEEKFYGLAEWPDVPLMSIDPADCNSKEVQAFIKKQAPDLLLSYGCHKLSDETLACATSERWNIHGGLSPWYKGAITHFWPSYMLEPQMTGMTLHDLTNQLDAGAVVHQCVAELVRGDGLHDLACRAVLSLAADLPALVARLAAGHEIAKKDHKTSGKLWPSGDWRPEHLRMVYEVYGDRIVDMYLDGKIEQRAPSLHRQPL
ncbi:formyltransferase family protein [Kordiimonas lipolytica]|uniref:Formyltransferase family protein n=1 Tax=Kordiimonas lipolytica TaxID=1662421 RepID=A0ABV8UEA8_9PROT|nr:formyltransferase family protein [Kordiimonas lipolytica]